MDSINIAQFEQLFDQYFFGAFLIFVTVIFFLWAAIHEIASFRLFTITNVREVHHYHYHATPPPVAAPEVQRAPSHYRVGVPAQQQPPPPRIVPPKDDGILGFMDQFFGDGQSTPPIPPVPRPRKRDKLSKTKRFGILQRDGFRCQLCGRKADESDDLTLHIDHKMPFSKGGTDADDNLWTLCSECNGGKSDIVVDELVGTDNATDDEGGNE